MTNKPQIVITMEEIEEISIPQDTKNIQARDDYQMYQLSKTAMLSFIISLFAAVRIFRIESLELNLIFINIAVAAIAIIMAVVSLIIIRHNKKVYGSPIAILVVFFNCFLIFHHVHYILSTN